MVHIVINYQLLNMPLVLIGSISIGLLTGWLSVILFYHATSVWRNVLMGLLAVSLLSLEILFFSDLQSFIFFLLAIALSAFSHWLWRKQLLDNL